MNPNDAIMEILANAPEAVKAEILAQMGTQEFEVLRLVRELTDPDDVPRAGPLRNKVRRLLDLAGYETFTGRPEERGKRRKPRTEGGPKARPGLAIEPPREEK